MRFNKLVPELSISNLGKSLRFYTEILGFKIEYQRKESKFAFLSFEGSQIMIEEINHHWETGKLVYPFGRGINIQIKSKNVDELYNSLRQHRYPIKADIMDNWYSNGRSLLGCRELLVMDPDGYLLRFSQDIGTKKLKS